jgi:hypothetical protein
LPQHTRPLRYVPKGHNRPKPANDAVVNTSNIRLDGRHLLAWLVKATGACK